VDAETLHPTWIEFTDIVTDLADRLAVDGTPDVVIGITRGGLIPAVLIAHTLGIRDVRTIEITHTTAEGRHAPKTDRPEVRNPLTLGDLAARDVLVVDDVAGSGETMTTALWLLDAERPARIRSAVCFLNEANWARDETRSTSMLNAIGETSPSWVVMPWEQHDPELVPAADPTQHHAGGAR
jgi:hypoxanthine phosphoribosyltransferase